MRLLSILILGLATTVSLPVLAQGDTGGARPIAVVAIENEAAPKLLVDQPLPAPLAKGQVFIGYRTGNIRIVPVYGREAKGVSPRIGHLHVTVDGGLSGLLVNRNHWRIR